MANAKAKGTRWETATVNYLNEQLGLGDLSNPLTIRRAVQYGQVDVGDVHAHPFVLQCKDVASPSVPKWLTAAAKQAAAAGFPHSAVVHKRRRMGVAAAHVYLTHATYSQVMAKLGAFGFGTGYGFTHGHLGRYMATDLRNFADLLRDLRAPLSAPSRADG